MRAGGVLSAPQEVVPALQSAVSPLAHKSSGAASDRIASYLIKTCACLAIVSLVLIFIFIGKEALPVFTSAEIRQEASLGELFLPGAKPPAFAWQPVSGPPRYSLLPLLAGTLKATLIAVLVAIPLAIAAALFTSEFAPSWAREFIKPVIELLAGIPSVVVGFFCLMVLAGWLQGAFGWTFRLNALTAGLGLSLAVIPIVYTMAEDAFNAVPRTYREGSLAMGATRWQTAWRIVLPASSAGLLAACVLGFGRAIGETMIVLMASGNAAILSLSPTDSIRTFSATIAAELGEVVVGSSHYHVLFFIGAFLFVLTFMTNLAGHWCIGRLQRKLQGGT
ncbi:MAG: phosphate ABC transporter permease subunit PstC [Planctomycetota bacterium]